MALARLLPASLRVTARARPISVGAFDATVAGNGHVNGGDADKLDGLGAMTLAGWVNLQANPAHGNRIMSKQVLTGNFDGFSFAFNQIDSNTPPTADNFKLNLALGGDGGFGFYTSNSNFSADDEWLFVAVTYDGTDEVTFYSGGEATTTTASKSSRPVRGNDRTAVAV